MFIRQKGKCRAFNTDFIVSVALVENNNLIAEISDSGYGDNCDSYDVVLKEKATQADFDALIKQINNEKPTNNPPANKHTQTGVSVAPTMSISEIGFPLWVVTKLHNVGIDTLDDLTKLKASELRKFRGVGRKLIYVVNERLKEMGLALKA